MADGVYKPGASGNRNANCQLKSRVALYGGFSGNESLRSERDWRNHVTVLSGDIDGNDVSDTNGVVITSTNVLGSNTYQVVTGSNIDASAVLDGFIITAGSQGDSWSGAGIDLSGNANPTLTNLVIRGNYGNGIASNSSDPNIINVVFLGNLQGMRNMSSQPKLINVVFSGNSGGSWGYVILNDSSAIVMINVIFQGNYGDVMFSLDWAWGQPVLKNCIVWGNTTSSGYGQIVPDGSAEVTYSIVQGGYTGTGNKGVDPRFIDPDGGQAEQRQVRVSFVQHLDLQRSQGVQRTRNRGLIVGHGDLLAVAPGVG